jgi:hypothetical protein
MFSHAVITDGYRSAAPLSPHGETPLQDDPACLEACRAVVGKLPMAKKWVIQGSLLSSSKTWGTIWRFDYEIPGEELPNLVNRVVCWRMPTGKLEIVVAVGHEVQPL